MAVIITICILVLIAYIFDVTSFKTKIPSVVLLLVLGWIVGQAVTFFELAVPDLIPVLPLLGTVGLILIVLEGSLELELNRSKTIVLKKAFITATIPMLLLAAALAYLFSKIGGYSFKDSLTNAIPLCVISSSIAIPSVANVSADKREFVIYESSMSDIIGVIFFNFITLNTVINTNSFLEFFLQMIAIVVISFVTTGALSYFLSKTAHHVKFVPIILVVILIYAISKVYHLPALVFIMVFGLFLKNLDELKQYNLIQKLKPDELNEEVEQFKDIVIEAAFLIRALFFILFGYLMKLEEIVNLETIPWALAIMGAVLVLRMVHLKATGMPLKPLLFVAPRGLITILLFLSIPATHAIPLVSNSLVIQLIIISAFIMMLGLMFGDGKDDDKAKNEAALFDADHSSK